MLSGRAFRFTLTMAVVAAVAALSVSAQSLAELAKKEAERRAKLKEKGVESIVVTNESLDRYKGIALNDGSSNSGPSAEGFFGEAPDFSDAEAAAETRPFAYQTPPEGYVSPPFEPDIVGEPDEGPRGAGVMRGGSRGGGEEDATDGIAEGTISDIPEVEP